MGQAINSAIPLQAPMPSRVLDDFSGQIGKMAPTALNKLEELSDQFGKIAPTAFNEYVRDLFERTVLFVDVLRQRGNQREEMLAHEVTSVLIYDSELVMRGDELPHPVNYSLLRVIPPEGVEVDDRKRPIFVIDPRAGQGPGIGGFKQASEIGQAFKAGHAVYFAGVTASPLEGQRIEDVARAFTIFLEKVAELHPAARGKPFVFGNWQAGWHAVMAACMRPNVVGPMVIAGTPLSYWGGVRGKNAMRYLGGWFGCAGAPSRDSRKCLGEERAYFTFGCNSRVRTRRRGPSPLGGHSWGSTRQLRWRAISCASMAKMNRWQGTVASIR